MSTQRLLTLEPRRWYAAEFIQDGPDGMFRSPSPILVHALRPLGTGRGLMYLHFRHANYPEGVQNKEYELQVLHRVSTYMFARQTKVDFDRSLLIFALQWGWLKTHFGLDPGECDVQDWEQQF